MVQKCFFFLNIFLFEILKTENKKVFTAVVPHCFKFACNFLLCCVCFSHHQPTSIDHGGISLRIGYLSQYDTLELRQFNDKVQYQHTSCLAH